MKQSRRGGLTGRVDLQVALLSCLLVLVTAGAVLLSCEALPLFPAVATSTLIALCACVTAVAVGHLCFRRISNPTHRDLSNTDRLTGLKSRNAFELDLENLHASKSWQMAGFVMVDLDNLKGVNDALGHTVGDDYLRNAANALWGIPGQDAAAYRVGGDEFVLLVRNATEEHLSQLAHQILARFAEHKPNWSVPVSLSVGWAAFNPNSDQNLHNTYRRADFNMYAAKLNHHTT